ncbi:MAG: M1 family metallopeptidase [Krumholzibacteria bacterium]|nr:M1 family metallopeptidase [Candidatus Krumholzibacteria bacterium]
MSRRDPHSYADLDQGRVSHLDLDLDLDFATSRITGRARLDLAAPAGGPLDLDTRDLEIRAVTGADGQALPFKLDPRDSILGAKLRVELPPGSASLTIAFVTSPEASALQWLEPAMTAGGRHPYLFSQCQAIHARSVIPCQDSPQARFTFDARVTVPEALTVVMAAAPGAATAGPRPGTRTFAFTMPQAVPPYLFAFAAGNLVSRDLGPRSRVYTEPELLEASAWEFADVDRMLLAAEEIFGPYLWDRFDFVVMPPSFPYGGMENPRLTFLTPTLLAGDRSLVNVLAHELAHSWTGNLVTNATIDDFWLNEGFTVWAERRILEKLEGNEAKALSAAIGRKGLQDALDNFGAGSPFTRLKTDSWGADPDEFYSMVPYEKGFLLVALMEQTAGRARFDAFVKKYIERFSFTSITTEQFEEFLEAELPGLAAEVGAEGWIRGEGLPQNAPVFTSAQLVQLQGLATGWPQGARPEAPATEAWTAIDWQIYLQALPRDIGAEGCAWLDEHHALTRAGNSEILCNWLALAVGNGHEPAYARAAEFVGQVGRMKYLKPLYTALHGNKATRKLAAETFSKHAPGYHPIARGGIERILAG